MYVFCSLHIQKSLRIRSPYFICLNLVMLFLWNECSEGMNSKVKLLIFTVCWIINVNIEYSLENDEGPSDKTFDLRLVSTVNLSVCVGKRAKQVWNTESVLFHRHHWDAHCVVMMSLKLVSRKYIPGEVVWQRKSGVLMVSLMDAGHVTAVDLLLWPQLIRAQLQHINSRWIAHRPWDGFSSEGSRPVKICSSGPVPVRSRLLRYTWQTRRWSRAMSSSPHCSTNTHSTDTSGRKVKTKGGFSCPPTLKI